MTSFDAFWASYLRAHSRPGTRGVHYFATVLGMAGVTSSAIWLDPWPGVIAIACAYVLAIGAHLLIEHNQPLILSNPFWGAVADMRMCLLALTGRLERELARHHGERIEARPQVPSDQAGATPAAPRSLS